MTTTVKFLTDLPGSHDRGFCHEFEMVSQAKLWLVTLEGGEIFQVTTLLREGASCSGCSTKVIQAHESQLWTRLHLRADDGWDADPNCDDADSLIEAAEAAAEKAHKDQFGPCETKKEGYNKTMNDNGKTAVNSTPHPTTLFLEGGDINLAKCENPSRAEVTSQHVRFETINGREVEIVRDTFGEPEDLPEPKDGVVLLVSRITAEAAKLSGRTTEDLRIPAGIVRDEKGRITGCTKLAIL